ncbi:hypothetical protein BKA65DRAFT_483637 [Rhexocercosporidium sp. MPI-PUGE-AT-0058]|nr:hypothetical protein BKA65DRAFT_483637 [Rhexocercosporidium sp. MPI-PUGE-AT-0058]
MNIRTSNRHLKSIVHWNRTPLLDENGNRPRLLDQAQIENAGWLLEAIFDYGEHDASKPTPISTPHEWTHRQDSFSHYRAGFEIRTSRLCKRFLTFHHFKAEADVGVDCLVRSTDFVYNAKSAAGVGGVYTFLTSAQQFFSAGEFPRWAGFPGCSVADVYSEGSPGLLTTRGSAWYFNRNTAPINTAHVEERLIQKPMVDSLEVVLNTPNVTASSQWWLLDVAGHGLASVFYQDEDAGVIGFYENDKQEDVWYSTLGEDGFGPPQYFPTFTDEEEGPTQLPFTQQEFIHFADISGDGLQDIVHICNKEICYWPNLGFGRFGAKVTMDRSPAFDFPHDFRPNRIMLADIDGSGMTDVIYLHSEGAKVFFNQCGNGWSDALVLDSLLHVDNNVSVAASDLLGNGTTCLVVSSLFSFESIAMRYLDLMSTKPHLLTRVDNNLGSVTEVTYAPSTKFYLQDKRAGNLWVTRLQFPVHVIESVRTYDRISKCMFASTYAYHHGYYDPEDKTIRVNMSPTSDLPPVHTKTWFHVGALLDRNSLSLHYEHEYFRDPLLSEDVARLWFLPDTVLFPEIGVNMIQSRSDTQSAIVHATDREVQRKTYITYPENTVRNKIDDETLYPGSYRVPAQCEAKSFELTGFERGDPERPLVYETWTKDDFSLVKSTAEIGFEEDPDMSVPQKRLLKQSRTLFRKFDLTGNLPLTEMDHMALSGQSYQLAFTSSILEKHLKKDGRALIQDLRPLLTGKSTDEGGYVISADLKTSGVFLPTDPDDCCWITSGEKFYSLEAGDLTVELQAARSNFYLPRRFRNPFGVEITVTYDDYNLLVVDTIDSIGNRKTIVAYDTLGPAVGTAVKRKRDNTSQVGDDLVRFDADAEEALTPEYIQGILADRHSVLTMSHNKVAAEDHRLNGTEKKLYTRTEMDITGNVLAVRDAMIQDGDDRGRVVTQSQYDMLGRPLHTISMEKGQSFILVNVLNQPMPALTAVLDTKLESDIYRASSTFDALNRLLTSQLPCSARGAQSRLRLEYNNLSLVTIDYNVRDDSASDELVWIRFVENLDYNAMGKRMLVDYGNRVRTTSEFDLETEALKRLNTWRNADVPNRVRDLLQDIKYTYDPMGHVTHVVDDAQETNFFRNVIASPVNAYTYDALYQLINATGREHLGQPPGPPLPYTNSDSKRFGAYPGDAAAMGLYTERYVYDDTANMIEMKHDSSDTRVDVASRTWTRSFTYQESSLTESDKTGNRLSYSAVGREMNNFVYDEHGNTVYMPHLGGSPATGNVKWDYLDQMKELDLGGGGTAYYTYDLTGRRIRKVIERGQNLTEERLYLGSVEFFRKKSASASFERETLHILDNKKRIALVESRVEDTAGTDRARPRLIRYQIATPNGSSAIELDDEAKTFHTRSTHPMEAQPIKPLHPPPKHQNATASPPKNLARWINVDPIGTGDGLSVYLYCHANPIGRIDPTGNADIPDESFASFDPLISSIDNSDFRKSLVAPRPALTPGSLCWRRDWTSVCRRGSHVRRHPGAALDEFGNVPVAGDLLDAARGGMDIGEALDVGLGISDVAAGYGDKVREYAKSIGFSEDTAFYIGARGAALSAVTVAPRIAFENMVKEWWGGRK